MNKYSKRNTYLLVIVILITAIVGIFYYSLQKKLVINTKVKNGIADWKTYSNDELNFQFKYPNDWQIFINIGSESTLSESLTPPLETGEGLTFIHVDKMTNGETAKYIQLNLTVVPNNQNLPLKQYFINQGWHQYWIDQMEETSVNGKTAVKMYKNPLNQFVTYYIEIKGYVIGMGFSFDEPNENFATPPPQIFDRVLYTFNHPISNADGITNGNYEGKFCGGFAGIVCPEGYTCKLEGNYPDAGGKCVKN